WPVPGHRLAPAADPLVLGLCHQPVQHAPPAAAGWRPHHRRGKPLDLAGGPGAADPADSGQRFSLVFAPADPLCRLAASHQHPAQPRPPCPLLPISRRASWLIGIAYIGLTLMLVGF